MPAPGPAGASSSTRWSARAWTGPTSVPASASTTCWVPASGVPSHLQAPLASKKTLQAFRGGKTRRDPGRHQVLRGSARRRPAHHDDRPDRGRLRRAVATSARVIGFPARRRAGRRCDASRIWRPARRSRSGRSDRDQRRRGVDRRDPADDRRQGAVPGAGVQGRAHRRRRGDRIESDTGLITETEKSLLFIIPCPWSDEFWVIGTTDTPWNLDLAHPAASRADIDYILEHANALLARAADPRRRRRRLRRACGRCWPVNRTRPASSPASTPASHPVPGLVIVAGGKYTTYRVMAEDAVDEAVKRAARARCGSRITDKVPLVGADGLQAAVHDQGEPGRPVRTGPPSGSSTCSAGTARAIHELLDLDRAAPRTGRAAGARAPNYLKVEAHYAVSHEGALHLDDILARRTAGVDRHLGPRRRRRRRRSPNWSHRCSAGTPRRSSREVEHYRRPGRGRARVAAATRRPDRRRRAARARRRFAHGVRLSPLGTAVRGTRQGPAIAYRNPRRVDGIDNAARLDRRCAAPTRPPRSCRCRAHATEDHS